MKILYWIWLLFKVGLEMSDLEAHIVDAANDINLKRQEFCYLPVWGWDSQNLFGLILDQTYDKSTLRELGKNVINLVTIQSGFGKEWFCNTHCWCCKWHQSEKMGILQFTTKSFVITLRSNVPTIRVPKLSKRWALMLRELFIKILISFMDVMSKVRLKMREQIADASNGIN